MDVSEYLIAQWVLSEAVANDILYRGQDGGAYFLGGDGRTEYVVEVKAFRVLP